MLPFSRSISESSIVYYSKHQARSLNMVTLICLFSPCPHHVIASLPLQLICKRAMISGAASVSGTHMRPWDSLDSPIPMLPAALGSKFARLTCLVSRGEETNRRVRLLYGKLIGARSRGGRTVRTAANANRLLTASKPNQTIYTKPNHI